MTTQSPSPKRTRSPMTAAELEARATARAHAEHVHIFKTDRPGVFTTKSKSDPSARYSLVARDGIVACSCKSYEFRKVCKHSSAFESRLAREAARAARVQTGHVAAAPSAAYITAYVAVADARVEKLSTSPARRACPCSIYGPEACRGYCREVA